jgi:hypothetical protein
MKAAINDLRWRRKVLNIYRSNLKRFTDVLEGAKRKILFLQ